MSCYESVGSVPLLECRRPALINVFTSSINSLPNMFVVIGYSIRKAELFRVPVVFFSTVARLQQFREQCTRDSGTHPCYHIVCHNRPSQSRWVSDLILEISGSLGNAGQQVTDAFQSPQDGC